MKTKRAILKCSRCKVTAQIIGVDGEPDHYLCPRCGLKKPYVETTELAQEQLRVLGIRQAQQTIKKTFQGGEMGSGWRYKPAKIADVPGDFYLEFEDKLGPPGLGAGPETAARQQQRRRRK